ncbi:MAG: hypothetical protein RBR63_04180 [Methanosarcina vacuolata]|jgi:hypothetical protein|nr:hypothetical protein [Methanosarcina vacuolata]
MCLIIDINVLSSVFSSKAQDHSEFEPIFNWILSGKGKIVYGGTQYHDELVKNGKYIGLFTILGNKGKVKTVPRDKVDKIQAKLEKDFPDPKFNDRHLASIVIASKCNLICTNDKESYPFLKNPLMYPKGVSKPKIYRSIRNVDLIDDHNIVEFCKPSEKLSKDDQASLNNILKKI